MRYHEKSDLRGLCSFLVLTLALAASAYPNTDGKDKAYYSNATRDFAVLICQ